MYCCELFQHVGTYQEQKFNGFENQIREGISWYTLLSDSVRRNFDTHNTDCKLFCPISRDLPLQLNYLNALDVKKQEN